MTSTRLRNFFARLVAVSLIGAGLMHSASAGVIGTGYVADAEARDAREMRIQSLLAADAVAGQLERLGVDPAAVADRVQGLSDAELIQLETRLGEQVAGGDVVGIVGAVFIVLLILELVGVTDVFTAI